MTADPDAKPPAASAALLLRFGANLRRARKAAGLTQAELADRTRCGQAYISAIERGTQNITLDTASELSAAVHVNVTDLMSHVEWKPASSARQRRSKPLAE